MCSVFNTELGDKLDCCCGCVVIHSNHGAPWIAEDFTVVSVCNFTESVSNRKKVLDYMRWLMLTGLDGLGSM